MSIRKILFFLPAMTLLCGLVAAQNSNSPYSRYGYGYFETPSIGQTKAMGNIGYGLRESGHINVLNPASLSSVDTTNMLFDFGISGQMSHFRENGNSQISPNGYLDYAAIKFALKPKWGLAFGLVPLSKVGYTFSQTYEDVVTPSGDETYTESYNANGGLNQVFLGTGLDVFKGFSLGANLKYQFGLLNYNGSKNYENSEYNDTQILNYYFLRTFGYDLGFQANFKLNAKSNLTLGGVYSASLPFDTEVNRIVIATDTMEYPSSVDGNFPTTYGAGLTYTFDDRLTIGADFEKQAWSKSMFLGSSDSLNDQTRLSLGVEYLPKLLADRYFEAIRYRAGFQFTDSYVKYLMTPTGMAPGSLKKVALTFGAGLPLRQQGTQRSVLNLAFEIGRLLPPDASYLSETYYKVSVGVSFNEMWFFKRKL